MTALGLGSGLARLGGALSPYLVLSVSNSYVPDVTLCEERIELQINGWHSDTQIKNLALVSEHANVALSIRH